MLPLKLVPAEVSNASLWHNRWSNQSQ